MNNMERFTLQIAGQVVSVLALHRHTGKRCHAYLCEAEPDFSVKITLQDIAFEQEVMARECTIEGIPV